MILKVTYLVAMMWLIISCRSRDQDSSVASSSGAKDEAACLFKQSEPVNKSLKQSPSADTFNLRIARDLALASKVAYKDNDEIEKSAKMWGYHKITPISYRNLAAFMMSNSKCAVLAFSGSSPFSLRDWIVNNKTGDKTVKHGNLHRGFHDAIVNMWQPIDGALANHRVKNKVFWVTGHSLGGALAGVFAYKSELDGPEWRTPRIDRVFTFGQPLFADESVAEVMRSKFQGRYFRVVNNTDMITRLPHWLHFVGSLIWLKEDKVEYIPEVPDSNEMKLSDGRRERASRNPNELNPSEEAFREFLSETTGTDGPDDPAKSGAHSFGSFSLPVPSLMPRWLKDHALVNYLEKINTFLGNQVEK